MQAKRLKNQLKINVLKNRNYNLLMWLFQDTLFIIKICAIYYLDIFIYYDLNQNSDKEKPIR